MTTSAEPADSHLPRLSRRMVLAYASSTILLLVIAFFVYSGIRELVDQSRWVAHTQEVLTALKGLESELIELQATQRSLLLTGHWEYQSRFHGAAGRLPGHLDRLGDLTADNPQQQQHLEAMNQLVNARVAVAYAVIETFQQKGIEAACEAIHARDEESVQAKVHGLIQAMEAEEARLLDQRRQASDRAVTRTLIVGSVCLGAVFSILTFVFWLIRRETLRREAAQEHLRKAHAQLEASLRQMQELTQQSALVSTLGDYLRVCRSNSEAYEIISRMVTQLLPGVDGAIGIISNSRNLVETVLTWGDNAGLLPTFSPEDCWGLRRGRIHLHTGLDDSEPMCRHLTSTPGSSLCVPMVIHGETLGVLTLRSAQAAGITDSERRAARAMAEQIAMALANLRLQEALRVQSIRDPVTGLYNRRYLEESLEREISRARRQHQPLAIVMIDIDHFKHFNDTYGHEAGDAILAEVGKLLISEVRADDIPCRYGGEEFCLVMPGATLDVAQARAESLRLAVKSLRVNARGQTLGPITLSAGVACFPTHGLSSAAVVNAADAALYQAKSSGRDRIETAISPPPTPSSAIVPFPPAERSRA